MSGEEASKSLSKDLENGPCCLIISPITPAAFQSSDDVAFIFEKIREECPDRWRRPIRNGNVMVIGSNFDSASLVFLEVLYVILKITVHRSASTRDGSADDAFVTPSCDCQDIFIIIQDILRSQNFQFEAFRSCLGRAFLSQRTAAVPVSIVEFCQLNGVVNHISRLRERISDLLTRPGEDQEFLTEVNRLRNQMKTTILQFNSLKEKIVENTSSVEAESGGGVESNSRTFQPSLQDGNPRRTELFTPRDSSETENNSDPHAYSLQRLLECLSERLRLIDWVKLRQYIALLNIPQRVLETTPNGSQMLQELVERNENRNLDWIKDAFYEIGRVDLVHLMDCIQDGDYSLLTELQAGLPRIGSSNTADHNGLSSSPSQQMQNLTLQDNVSGARATYEDQYVTRSPTAAARGETGDTGDNGRLHRKFRNVPQSSQSSPIHLVQEHVKANETSTTAERATDRSSGDNTTWVENPPFSCEHYDRRCDVQFSCCPERFWPCHRCHNYNSSCSSRKLRSRDIKMIKCKRCGKVQQFPKESQHCIECNLKFAEYFCPLCQHLTGTQNHPFHCEKCGICRVHGDRSFHCDVCGVCLDINLRGNHRCRAGSAHDECCICFEDAFTGCQILPCSHKVHKDCATLMLRNGITRCPICRESFAHRIERRPIP